MLKGLQHNILFFSCFILVGCDNYPAGYQDGYANKQEKSWIVLDKAGYKKGYQAAQAEQFQADWLAENMTMDENMQCRGIIVQSDPLMFLPGEYERISTDIYQIKQ